MGLQETFNKMPTKTRCEFKFNGEYDIILIPWIKKGRGFGEYCFFVKDGRIKLDNESDPPEAIKEVIDDLIDNNIESVREMFYHMVALCEHTDKLL